MRRKRRNFPQKTIFNKGILSQNLFSVKIQIVENYRSVFVQRVPNLAFGARALCEVFLTGRSKNG
jgi:hypothetical protein